MNEHIIPILHINIDIWLIMINMCEQNPIQSHDFVRLQLAVWSQRLQGGDGHTLQLGKTWIWYDMIWYDANMADILGKYTVAEIWQKYG